ncbi:MAG: NAD(P)-dependent oxidoreductase [Planctomycetes bacterium]|nr:NAD(P)-dependent oxidoreductase [Planctomycetota bacterium]
MFSAFKGARVLVLGADGFIGRWVARLLTEGGADVVLAVKSAELAKEPLARFGAKGDVREVDLFPPGAASVFLRDVKPMVLFNLAGYGVARDQRDEKAMWRLNDDLLGELALAFPATRVKGWSGTPFVHAGTAAEYGALAGDLSESSECAPTSSYGRTKLKGTQSLLLRADLAGYPAFVGRLFTVYGPGEIAGRLLPTLLAARATNEPIELTAGTQQRDFTYVEEAAEGLLRLALARTEEPQVVNVATGKLTTVRGFAMTAAAVLGLPIARLRFGALPTAADEMQHEPVTHAKLRALTGWVPKLQIPDGVAKARAFEAASV